MSTKITLERLQRFSKYRRLRPHVLRRLKLTREKLIAKPIITAQEDRMIVMITHIIGRIKIAG